ncbi:hypothetical protein NFI96_006293 [Prochilodus magdalenae]|nr:hypothetical protein NFI96_006293 [Prochilodus magdalenae]
MQMRNELEMLRSCQKSRNSRKEKKNELKGQKPGSAAEPQLVIGVGVPRKTSLRLVIKMAECNFLSPNVQSLNVCSYSDQTLGVKESDGLGKEAVAQSGCEGPDASRQIVYTSPLTVALPLEHGTVMFPIGMDYLMTHMYGNAARDDLWNKFSEAMQREGKDINIKEVMDRWTLQMGYPVVTISKNDSLDNTVTITQEHFVYDIDAKLRDPDLFNKSFRLLRLLQNTRALHRSVLSAVPTENTASESSQWKSLNSGQLFEAVLQRHADGNCGVYKGLVCQAVTVHYKEMGLQSECEARERLGCSDSQWEFIPPSGSQESGRLSSMSPQGWRVKSSCT